MKHFPAFPILVFMMCLPAAADIKGCYIRTYGADVLKRHPQQAVTKVVVRYGIAPNDQEGFEDDVVFELRGRAAVESSSYSCKGSKTKLTCRFTDLGNGSRGGRGSFTLRETTSGVVMNPTSDLVMAPAESGKPFTLKVLSNPDHKAFTLKKVDVDLETCGG